MVRFALRLAVSKILHVQGWQSRKCTELPQTKLKHLTVKSTLYTLNTFPKVQILVRFTLRLAVSEIQGRQKSEMH